MTITVSPTDRSNFHISLKDSAGYELGLIVAAQGRGGIIERDIKFVTRAPVDRTAMKTSSGNQEYSDLRPPYTSLAQDDFSGGRGNEDLRKDATRYLDAGGLNTKRGGYLHLNGQEQFSGLLRRGAQKQVASMVEPVAPNALDTKWATRLNITDDGTYDQVWIYSHSKTVITGAELFKGSDPAFQTLLATLPTSQPPSYAPGWHIFNLTSPVTLAAADDVWVSIPLNPPTLWAYMPSITGAKKLNDGNVISAAGGFACRVVKKVNTTTDADRWAKFFIYKSQLYLVKQIASGTKMWMNGYRGKLTAGTTTAATTNLTLSLDELAGKVFLVTGGAGYDEAQRWRIIASNTAGANSVITMEEHFDFDLSTSEFVILGTDTWTEITGHGLHITIHDILVSDKGIVYFSEGQTHPLRKMREYNNAGTWTREFADDIANGPDYMVQIGEDIWAAFSNTGTVKYSKQQDWGTNLSWKEKNIPCGDKYARFTGLDNYQDSAGYAAVAVLKEDIPGFVSVSDKTFVPMKLLEMRVMRDERNGRAHLVHDTNLYLSFVNGFERFYHPNLDDIGVNRDEGLPNGRQGDHRCVAGYPGHFFVGIDAGDNGYSGIFSSGGWHEEWRGAKGQRPLAMIVQVIPGEDNLDRLWIATGGRAGGDVNYIPLPSETSNPLEDDNMIYTTGGYLETSKYFTDLAEAKKYISQVKLVFDQFDIDDHYIKVEYRIEGDNRVTGWKELSGETYSGVNNSEARFTLTDVESETPSFGLQGYWIYFRIWLYTTDQTSTPVLKAFIVDALTRVVNKYAYTIPFVLEGGANDPAKDLLGVNDDIPSPSTKLTKLRDWSDGGPLYLRSTDIRLHDKMVFMLPFADSLIEVEETGGRRVYLGQLTVQDA